MLILQKWQIVKCSIIIIGIACLIILIFQGINETSLRMAIRLTARTSCLLFLLTFCASSVGKYKSNSFSHWLLSNRRYLGLSMAVSHVYHAIVIMLLAISTSQNMIRDSHSANLGYIFIILMTITSFQRPAAILGRRNWRILHTVGIYYLWLSFTYAFSSRLSESWLIYTPFVAALIIALCLRLIANNKRSHLVNNNS